MEEEVIQRRGRMLDGEAHALGRDLRTWWGKGRGLLEG